MAIDDRLRMIARVARMYYEWNMNQSAIANQLGLSQTTVSRLLDQSKKEGIIRISVQIPDGIYTELEEGLVKKFSLRDVVVVDCISSDDEKSIVKEIGTAAAYYFENVIRPNEVIGLSSWSATLIAMVDAMHPIARKSNVKVVQILGGVGTANAQVFAAHLANRLANNVNGPVIYLPLPAVVSSEESLNVLIKDDNVNGAFSLFPQVTMALVGIGSVSPSQLLAASGNIFTESELQILRKNGAVGDILLNFYNKDGLPLHDILKSRVISMSLEQLCEVDRAIGVAGGERKYAAILGALRGKLINILITDQFTANKLCSE